MRQPTIGEGNFLLHDRNVQENSFKKITAYFRHPVNIQVQCEDKTLHISLICDKSVTTQNFAFFSHWYGKKKFADALLTGIVS